MANSKSIFQELIQRIITYHGEEARSIAFLIMEYLYGISTTDIAAEKDVNNASQDKLTLIIDRLNRHEPIQYVLGETYFYGRKFSVSPHVLIPRPETEELIEHVVQLLRKHKKPRIVDVGTGSGCIAVTLSHELPRAEVFATDVSDGALQTAGKNAIALGASVKFIQSDILKELIPVSDLDGIVSNPPYVALSEKKYMRDNVLSYEPHLALFVQDDDPLVFYTAIANQAKATLRSGGIVAVEINERFGKEVERLFSENGFLQVQIVKDIGGRDRIVSGIKV